MVRVGWGCGDHGPSGNQSEAVTEAERAIDRALAPKKLRLVPPLGCRVDSRGCRVSINAIKIGGRMYPAGL